MHDGNDDSSTVLIIDDDPENVKKMKLMATEMGMKIDSAIGGSEGIKMVKTRA